MTTTAFRLLAISHCLRFACSLVGASRRSEDQCTTNTLAPASVEDLCAPPPFSDSLWRGRGRRFSLLYGEGGNQFDRYIGFIDPLVDLSGLD